MVRIHSGRGGAWPFRALFLLNCPVLWTSAADATEATQLDRSRAVEPTLPSGKCFCTSVRPPRVPVWEWSCAAASSVRLQVENFLCFFLSAYFIIFFITGSFPWCWASEANRMCRFLHPDSGGSNLELLASEDFDGGPWKTSFWEMLLWKPNSFFSSSFKFYF